MKGVALDTPFIFYSAVFRGSRPVSILSGIIDALMRSAGSTASASAISKNTSSVKLCAAVSYTHLDVYKRQLHHMSRVFRGNMPVIPPALRIDSNFLSDLQFHKKITNFEYPNVFYTKLNNTFFYPSMLQF